MALGKNLKKKELISGKRSKTKSTKKKVEKKKLIQSDKETPKKSTPKVKKKSLQQVFTNFISEREHERKNEVRKRQKQEVAAIADRQVQFVILKIGAEEFAMDIAKVREVVVAPELSEAPETPEHILGIAAVRGNTFLAMDLAIKFRKKGKTQSKYFLAVDDKKNSVGFLLENLPSTLKIDGKKVSSNLTMLDNTTKDITYIKGIIQLENRLIFYLDVDELIASDKSIVLPEKLMS